jgi:hypothetical protein
MLGYTSEHFFGCAHAIYPMLRPAMEELSRGSSLPSSTTLNFNGPE